MDTKQGNVHLTNAWLLAVLGMFILGIVLGPLAVNQAAKAEACGVPAGGPKVLGWVATIICGIAIVVVMIGSMPK